MKKTITSPKNLFRTLKLSNSVTKSKDKVSSMIIIQFVNFPYSIFLRQTFSVNWWYWIFVACKKAQTVFKTTKYIFLTFQQLKRIKNYSYVTKLPQYNSKLQVKARQFNAIYCLTFYHLPYKNASYFICFLQGVHT